MPAEVSQAWGDIAFASIDLTSDAGPRLAASRRTWMLAL